MNNPTRDFTLSLAAGASAFGDGTHPTTRGVMEMIAAIDPAHFTPRIACDMGAGSGILSLMIAQQFSCPVVAVDIAETCLPTLQQNAQQNGVALGVYFNQPSLLPLRADGFAHRDIAAYAPYDVITANMLAEPLIHLASDMQMHLSAGGVLIISGILQWQETTIRQAYDGLGLELASRIVIGDWVTLGYAKP